MRPSQTLLALSVAALLLTGCGGDPAADRRAQVAALTEAANDKDAGAVRSLADELVEMVTAQAERQELAADEAERLAALATAVGEGADLIDEDLIERRRAEAEAEAERQRLEQERKQLEEERKQLEEERKKDEEERKKGEEERKKDEDKDGD